MSGRNRNRSAAPPVSAEPASTAPPIHAEPVAEPPRDRQPADGSARPPCPYCSKEAIAAKDSPDGKATPAVVVRCKSGGGGPFFTRYYCPTAGCQYSQKVQRPRPKPSVEQDEFAAR